MVVAKSLEDLLLINKMNEQANPTFSAFQSLANGISVGMEEERQRKKQVQQENEYLQRQIKMIDEFNNSQAGKLQQQTIIKNDADISEIAPMVQKASITLNAQGKPSVTISEIENPTIKIKREQRLERQNQINQLKSFGGVLTDNQMKDFSQSLGFDLSAEQSTGRVEAFIDPVDNQKKFKVLDQTEYNAKVSQGKLAPSEIDYVKSATEELSNWKSVLNSMYEQGMSPEDLTKAFGSLETIDVQSPLGVFSIPARFTLAQQFAENPKYITIARDLEKAFASFRKRITGAQASDKEIQYLRKIMPALTDNPAQFFASMEDNIGDVSRTLNDTLDVYKRAGRNVDEYETLIKDMDERNFPALKKYNENKKEIPISNNTKSENAQYKTLPTNHPEVAISNQVDNITKAFENVSVDGTYFGVISPLINAIKKNSAQIKQNILNGLPGTGQMVGGLAGSIGGGMMSGGLGAFAGGVAGATAGRGAGNLAQKLITEYQDNPLEMFKSLIVGSPLINAYNLMDDKEKNQLWKELKHTAVWESATSAIGGVAGNAIKSIGKTALRTIVGKEVIERAQEVGWKQILQEKFKVRGVPTEITEKVGAFFKKAQNDLGVNVSNAIKPHANKVVTNNKTLLSEIDTLMDDMSIDDIATTPSQKKALEKALHTINKNLMSFGYKTKNITANEVWETRKEIDKIFRNVVLKDDAKIFGTKLRSVLNNKLTNLSQEVTDSFGNYHALMGVVDDYGSKFEKTTINNIVSNPKLEQFAASLTRNPELQKTFKSIEGLLSKDVHISDDLMNMMLSKSLDDPTNVSKWLAAVSLGGNVPVINLPSFMPKRSVANLASALSQTGKSGKIISGTANLISRTIPSAGVDVTSRKPRLIKRERKND